MTFQIIDESKAAQMRKGAGNKLSPERTQLLEGFPKMKVGQTIVFPINDDSKTMKHAKASLVTFLNIRKKGCAEVALDKDDQARHLLVKRIK